MKHIPNIIKNNFLNVYTLIITASLLLVFLWFRDGVPMATAESGFPFYDMQRMNDIVSRSWTTLGLGENMRIRVAGKTFFWFFSKLELIGFPAFLSQAFFFFLVLSVSGIAIFKLTKLLFPKLNSKYAILSPFFYWFNPISSINVWHRFLNNYMVMWAGLPLLLYLFIKGIEEKKYSMSILTVLASAGLSFIFTSPVFLMLVWFLFLSITLFYSWADKGSRIFYVKYIALTLLSFVIVNAWWIVGLSNYISSTTSQLIKSFFSSTGNLSTLTAISKTSGKLLYLTRFLPAGFLDTGPKWVKYYDNFFVSLLSFMAFLMLFWGVIRFKNNKKVLLLGSIWLFSLFLVKGNQPPLGEIYQYIFSLSTVFQGFRNPYEKFGFLLPLATAPLFSYSVYKISSAFKKRTRAAFFLLVVLFLTSWGKPFLTGEIFIREKSLNSDQISYKTLPPSYYQEIDKWLKDLGDDRFVSLPLGGEGMTYLWPEGEYSGIELSGTLFANSSISYNTTIPYFHTIASEIRNEQLNDNLLNYFPFINSRYIMLRKDIDYKERRVTNPDVAEKFLDDLASREIVKKIREEGQLSVYQVEDKWWWPKLYLTDTYYATNRTPLSRLASLEKDFPQKKIATIYSQDATRIKSNVSAWSFYPDATIFPQRLSLAKNLSDEDLLSKLFYSKHLPGSFIYRLAVVKEWLQTPPKSDYWGRILYKTGILGKRTAEVFKLYRDAAPADLIDKSEKKYIKTLRNISVDLTSDLDNTNPAYQVIVDSLLYQYALLDKCCLEAKSELAQKLFSMQVLPHFQLPDSPYGRYIVYNFNINEPGNYYLYYPNLNDNSGVNWYLDGNETSVDFSGVQSKENMYLEKGVHEVALLVEEKDFKENIIQKGEFNLDETNNYRLEVDVPPEPTEYELNFYFKFKKGNSFKLNFQQDIDPEKNPRLLASIGKDPDYHDWTYWRNKITTSPGAESISIRFLPNFKSVCQRNIWLRKACKEEKIDFSVEIKDFNLTLVKLPEISLIRYQELNSGSTDTELSFKKVDRTKYIIEIDKKENKQEMLVFSEMYDSGWRARYVNGDIIPEDKHFLVNLYANGWLVDNVGKNQIIIEFTPQRRYKYAIFITLFSLIIVTFYYFYIRWKEQRN